MESPPVGLPPFLVKGHVTVGTFNSISKITKEVAETWSKIVKQVDLSSPCFVGGVCRGGRN